MRLDACRMIDLPKIVDPRGSLTFVEGGRHVPFEIRRVYHLYDMPGGAARAGHGHKTLEQLIVAVSGSFDVAVDDGRSKTSYHLNRADSGLYMPSMIWRQIDNFSTGSVCMVLASDYFDEADYYRDYDAFVRAARTAP